MRGLIARLSRIPDWKGSFTLADREFFTELLRKGVLVLCSPEQALEEEFLKRLPDLDVELSCYGLSLADLQECLTPPRVPPGLRANPQKIREIELTTSIDEVDLALAFYRDTLINQREVELQERDARASSAEVKRRLVNAWVEAIQFELAARDRARAQKKAEALVLLKGRGFLLDGITREPLVKLKPAEHMKLARWYETDS